MLRRSIVLNIMAAGVVSACGAANDRAAYNGPPMQVVVLDDSLSELRAGFNAGQGHVRLLFIIGPTCGPCLRGLIDMNDALGENLLADGRLDVFVVHVPTLSAEPRHARRAAQLLRGGRVHHYWDPSGATGEVVQHALRIPVYAWDVWLTFGPDALWEATAPPAPATWSHQLGGLRQGVRLDPEAFAADVRARVEQIP